MLARLLNLLECIINMDKKIRDVMLGSVLNRVLNFGVVIFIGTPFSFETMVRPL